MSPQENNNQIISICNKFVKICIKKMASSNSIQFW